MAFSGTVSQTVFNTRKVIDRAFGRCKMPAATISSEHIDIAKDALYLLISQLANHAVPLWCVQRRVYPLYEGVGDITCDLGTVDLLSVNLRTVNVYNESALTKVSTPTSYTLTWADTLMISVIGIKWNADALQVYLERSNDGVVWELVQVEQPTGETGEWSWFDLVSVKPATRYRIRSVTPMDFQEAVFAGQPTEIPVARLNRDDWASMPNKVSQGRPLQYWFDRQVRQPVMHLWPVPSFSLEFSQIIVLAHRHIMDVGNLQQEIEVPQRWYDALVAGLAVRLAREVAEADPANIPRLDAEAKEALAIAQAEERDNAPINFAPMIGVYTR